MQSRKRLVAAIVRSALIAPLAAWGCASAATPENATTVSPARDDKTDFFEDECPDCEPEGTAPGEGED